jgi:nifR3 family TIM-barrel protein
VTASAQPSLRDPFTVGGVRVPNRVLLAPLAGIGNWFVRLQAKRYGAGMAVSEMVSSHAIHHRNPRTLRELLRIEPSERLGGPVSIQLFGSDADVMRHAARAVAAAGADMIDLNMGCPVPKVCRTGSGAALLTDPDRAVALARAAREGGGLPVTVKLRCGRTAGDDSGMELARRLVDEAHVSAIALHPRAASAHHKGTPDYELAAQLAQSLDAPVILTGGLREADHIREVFRSTGVAAVMLARGSLGNPWLFEQLVGERLAEPNPAEVAQELDWVMQRAAEHLGAVRASSYLRKFYPWYAARLRLDSGGASALRSQLQSAPDLAAARELFAGAVAMGPVPVGV